MKIHKIHIVNLRNHADNLIELSPLTNIIHGSNGSGKTTILESVALASHSKSFQPTDDKNLIRWDENRYFVNVFADYDLEVPYEISINYNRGSRKQINSSKGENLFPKDIIGEMPIVILTPDYKAITFGSPQDRRQFIDTVLSQASKYYVDAILKQKKYLKHRNAILGQFAREHKIDEKLLATATDFFISYSSDVIYKRFQFIKEFIPFFKQSYAEITDSVEIVDLQYKPDNIAFSQFAKIEKSEITEQLVKASKNLYQNELRRGTTLFGPQKDDIDIFINQGLAKDAASQGQHKSLLISLKFAEFEFLKTVVRETPIILLDDIFSELDAVRSQKVLELLLTKNAQTLITVTEPDKFIKLQNDKTNFKIISLSEGRIVS
ncbi:MAG: DNA replication and repair protein RecF [Desulfobulbaceae bacterium]|nr:DNA replication and repair protein RecF [Candidatus Kapabacteria bacterium]MBS3999917.1 DNA replication and repair protein RecF [Desulfobulbaceae bacterium]